jgi:FkbH-like protein
MSTLLVSNITMDPLVEQLREFSIEKAPFGTHILTFMDPSSEAFKEDTKTILLYLDGDELFRDPENRQEAAEFLGVLGGYLERHPEKTVLLNSLAVNPLTVDTYSDLVQEHSLVGAERWMNDQLQRLARQYPSLVLVNLDQIVRTHGFRALLSPAYWYAGRIRYSNVMFRELAATFRGALRASLSQSKKVLVLDLDNTLWGGVLGEDGIHGVALSEQGKGKCFRDFQRAIHRLASHGVLLALCSKNNPADVEEAFEQHPMTVLRASDFVARRINWDNKADNIRSIAEELNLGLDSFVFLDDNPVERSLVKHHLPEVEVPEFPERPELLPDWFVTAVVFPYFPKYRITQEDRQKVAQYHANARRSELMAHVDLKSFIERLEIQTQFYVDDRSLVERMSQMTQKTNQFNLTTQRYSVADIVRFIEGPDHVVIALEYEDRFGKEGITGLAIADLAEARLDTFLLSCRIIGRGVEDSLLAKLEALAQHRGHRAFHATFCPTKKNKPAEGFLERVGYRFTGEENGGRRYVREL